MRFGRCSHCMIWSMSGSTIRVGCPHCGYVKAEFESHDVDNDRMRTKVSQLNHDSRCERWVT